VTAGVRVAVAGVLAGLGTAAARRAADALPGGAERWTRTNHRGEPVSLLEGPSTGAGLLVGALAAGPLAAPALVAGAGGLAFGLVDDLAEDTSRSRKGLRGHLGALAHGELTTGGLKVLGIGATSLVAAALATRGSGTRGVGRAFDVVTGGALVAASANLVNLLDLRPGRALKAAGLAAVPTLVGGGAAVGAGVLAAAAAALPADLAERDMLGDGGANAIGAVLGVAALGSTGRAGRLAVLAGLVGLTLASEKVSFSRVIERTPALRALDSWGRRA